MRYLKERVEISVRQGVGSAGSFGDAGLQMRVWQPMPAIHLT